MNRRSFLQSTSAAMYSEVLRALPAAPMPVVDLVHYNDHLDRLWSLFGEDRMLFGSDWPNGDTLADFDQTFNIAQRYIATRSVAARGKYFWRNSLAVYKWRPRTPAQERLAGASSGPGV